MSYKVIWFDGITTQEKSFTEKYDALTHYAVLIKANTPATIYLKDRERWFEVCPTEDTNGDLFGSKKLLVD